MVAQLTSLGAATDQMVDVRRGHKNGFRKIALSIRPTAENAPIRTVYRCKKHPQRMLEKWHSEGNREKRHRDGPLSLKRAGNKAGIG